MLNIIIFIAYCFNFAVCRIYFKKIYSRKKDQDAETKAKHILEQAKKEAQG